MHTVAKKSYVGMVLEPAPAPGSYDVRLPEAGLGWEKVGPLFERYSVSLLGEIDQNWIATYQRVAEAAPNLTRFRLDSSSGTVSFTCRATDGPVQVMAVLKILGEMLERVNGEATAAATNPQARPSARPRPVPSR